MYEVDTTRNIPKQVMNLTQLLEMNPVDISTNVNDLINIVKTTIENYNATSLFVVYFIGKTMNDAVLGGKYPGLTVTKLAKALGMTQSKASRYHRIANLLTPQEVYDLRKIPYKCILRFPQIAEEYGEAKLKELKFRLITKDFEGVKSGTGQFNAVLDEIAKECLEMDRALPDATDNDPDKVDVKMLQSAAASPVIDAASEIVNPCAEVEDNGEDDDDMTAVDKILEDRNKAAKEGLDDTGRKSKSETARKASIALAQAKRALQKVRSPMTKIAEEAQPVLEALWQFEDYIIGDNDIDASYRELMEDFSAAEIRTLEAILNLHKELQKHGFALRKIEIPEGATAETLLDPKN